MSPSSRLHRRARAAHCLGPLLGLLLAVFPPPAGAQVPPAGAQAQLAVLLAGPRPVHDLPMFPPNTLDGQEGEYGPAGQPWGREQAWVVVLYTAEPLVLPRAWAPKACGSLRLLEVGGQERYTLCHADEQGYTLFFSFVGAAESGGPELPENQRCPFVEAFVRRFRALRSFVGESELAPLPGVLEITAR